ncbi:MAG: hypothetical protein ABI891_06785 [Acidobacteriota bacterium]
MESKKMRFSRLGILVLILFTVLIGANCSYYSRIIARKNLVDGGKAYKNRKFKEAEQLFRDAIAREPEGSSIEGKTAQLFLARTLHSEYIANRSVTPTAEAAIQEYKKVLTEDPNDQSSFKAIANLLENLGRNDEALAWTTERANNEQIPKEQRAEAYTSLAAKKYSCANDISDVEPVKKTVTKDGKQVFEFVKPENPEEYATLQKCVQEGTDLIDKAVALDPNSDSAWSYKANFLVQQGRVAEMEGNSQLKEELKAKAEEAKNRFTELSAEKKRIADEAEAKKKAEEEAANKEK